MRTIETSNAKSVKNTNEKTNVVKDFGKMSNEDLLALCEDEAKRLASSKTMTDVKAKGTAVDKGTDKACKSKKANLTPQDAYMKHLIDEMVKGSQANSTFGELHSRTMSYIKSDSPEGYYTIQKNKAEHTMLLKSFFPSNIHVIRTDKNGVKTDFYYLVSFVYKTDKVKPLELGKDETLVGFNFSANGCKSASIKTNKIEDLLYTTKHTENVVEINTETHERITKTYTDDKGVERNLTQEVERTYYPVLLGGGDANKARIKENKIFFTAFAKALAAIVWKASK